ncbi:hypothetical protein BKA65DRAFT_520616 [Rhexocercosporidium sp. MPI-PUGE-AT-0058]|nr:hypothetical protein BKA65DRAFT_520616 [Rhexocercosporidium sp. MPI-PUGE-AT-0058]
MLRIIFYILGLLVLLRAAHAGPDPVITAAVSHGIHELFRRYTFDDCHTEMESLEFVLVKHRYIRHQLTQILQLF